MARRLPREEADDGATPGELRGRMRLEGPLSLDDAVHRHLEDPNLSLVTLVPKTLMSNGSTRKENSSY
jgi:hypothetical protein